MTIENQSDNPPIHNRQSAIRNPQSVMIRFAVMKKTMIGMVFALTVAAWTPAAQQLPDCPDLVRALQAMMSQDARLRDWALLARYRDANKGAKARVVFMGDSITDAWIRPEYGGFFPGKPYADRGIS